MDALCIVGWKEHFENADSRKIANLSWFKCPVKMDGLSYRLLVQHKDGAAHFGIWIILLEIAAKCPTRGLLVRSNGIPLDVAGMSLMSGIPESSFKPAIERLLQIGWIKQLSFSTPLHPGEPGRDPDEPGRHPGEVVLEERRGEEKRGEEIREECNINSPPQASADHTQSKPEKLSDRDKAIEVYNAYPRHVGREAAIKAIMSAAVRLKASGNHDPWTHLLVAARAFAASPAGRVAKPDYRPHPSTWFNQGRFDDDRKEWEKSNGNELLGSSRQGRIEAPAGKYDDLSNRSNVIRLEPPGTLARPSESMEAHGSNPPLTGGNGSKAMELSDADIPF